MKQGSRETFLKNNVSMGSLRVFLVENHEDTVRYMQLYLEQLSYEVRVAGDMATALREIPRSGCDVLISDIGLPDGDGWQLMERLGDQRPQFAIAMSGYGTVDDQRRSRASGYDHHLVKPFAPDALVALLREASKLKEKQT
jgi:DNA-binding response OmpR family regulator